MPYRAEHVEPWEITSRLRNHRDLPPCGVNEEMEWADYELSDSPVWHLAIENPDLSRFLDSYN